MQREILSGFSFDGQSAGCNFNLTLVPHAPSFLDFRLLLTGSVVVEHGERRFSCGCTLVRMPGSDFTASTDLVLERLELLSPTRLDAECVLLLTDALREWFLTALASRSAKLD